MSLAITAGSQALVPGSTVFCAGNGGVEPYTYSVVAGGAGGTIDSSSGLYTAPSSLPTDPAKFHDVVRVTDSAAATASLQIMVGTPLMLLCDIIQKELNLDPGQVYLYNQKINIPTDSKLYIAVGILTVKPFGNRNKLNSSGESEQSANFMATLSIDILSRGPAARDRKEEIVMALKSDYAQSQQELNSFYIARLTSSFQNLSQEDGAAIPYRFNISVNVQYAAKKTKAVPYFDDFEGGTVTTEDAEADFTNEDIEETEP